MMRALERLARWYLLRERRRRRIELLGDVIDRVRIERLEGARRLLEQGDVDGAIRLLERPITPDRRVVVPFPKGPQNRRIKEGEQP